MRVQVCALRFTSKARERIEAAGGLCQTFDQLALVAPTGKRTVLIQGTSNTSQRSCVEAAAAFERVTWLWLVEHC